MLGFRSRDACLRLAPVLMLVMLVILLVSGCSPASTRFELYADAYGPGHSGSEVPRPVMPAEHRVDLDQIPEYKLDPEWTQRFSGNIDIAISPRGDLVVVTGQRGTGLEFRVYSSDKTQLWQEPFYRNHKLVARFLHEDGYLGVWVHDSETRGHLYVYGPDWKRLFSVAVRGPMTARMSDDASRVVVVEHSQKHLRVFDIAGTQVGSTHRVSQGAGVRFVPGSTMVLVEDDHELRVLGGDGAVVRRFPMNRDLRRAVLLSPDGAMTAVTTGQGDNALHMVDDDLDPVWPPHLLQPGGNNDLVFSAGGDHLLVYNVGRRGGLYMFDAASGQLLWRSSFDIDPDRQLITWRGMAFSSSGNHVVGHLGIRDTGGNQVSEHSALVIISIDGGFTARVPLGSNLEVALSRDGSLLALADGTPGPWIYTLDIVRFFDLRWLLEPVGEMRGD